MDTNAAWQGSDWDRISTPHVDMGSPALDRLDLGGDERVLDAGCGSGRITELLMERLPGGSSVALDGSASMLREARARLARFGDRVSYVQADLGTPPLAFGGLVDAVMSTATFHWVRDHDALFAGLAGTIRPGGQLSFQCGGEGNAAELIASVLAAGTDTRAHFTFAGPADTERRLQEAGFEDIQAWLQPHTVEFETRAELLDYIVVPYLRPALGWADRDLYELAGTAADRLGRPAIDYVRLNVTARSR